MSTRNNTPGSPDPQYVWHATGDRVSWPALLRLWGAEVARLQPGAGSFVCELLLQLADQAACHRLQTPEEHARYRAETAAEEALWIQALEADAHRWDREDEPEHPFDCNAPDVFGSLLGPDEHTLKAWLSQDPDDETRVN